MGFLGSYPRSLRLGSEAVTLGCSGHLCAHPDHRSRGIGAQLLRRYLSGPQRISITDGATDEVRGIWTALGGQANGLASVGWTRVLAPASYSSGELVRRAGRGWRRAPAALAWVDRVAGRAARPVPPATRTEALTAATIADPPVELGRAFALRPADSAETATWLTTELDRMFGADAVARRIVLTESGRPLGWYVAILPDGSPGTALQVVAATEAAVGAVLDQLFQDAAEAGCTAIRGRVEPHLQGALKGRRCTLAPSEWALIHGDPAAVGLVLGGRGLLTRLEGEWWLMPQRLQAAVSRTA